MIPQGLFELYMVIYRYVNGFFVLCIYHDYAHTVKNINHPNLY